MSFFNDVIVMSSTVTRFCFKHTSAVIRQWEIHGAFVTDGFLQKARHNMVHKTNGLPLYVMQHNSRGSAIGIATG
jgi:hypothetical protein